VCIAAADNPEFEWVDGGATERGWFVGRCSEFVTEFGCFRIIDRGERARGPVPLGAPPQSICVD
jgi:hypothetical protein